jgi:hypothetical protein
LSIPEHQKIQGKSIFYWLSEIGNLIPEACSDETKKIGMNFNPVFVDTTLLLHKKVNK